MKGKEEAVPSQNDIREQIGLISEFGTEDVRGFRLPANYFQRADAHKRNANRTANPGQTQLRGSAASGQRASVLFDGSGSQFVAMMQAAEPGH